MTKESSDLHATVNADGAIILDIRHGKISTLNSTGAYIWEALKRGESVDVIVSALSGETGEPSLTVEQDVREFIKTLQEKQLLVR
jgi:hypothetical protein